MLLQVNDSAASLMGDGQEEDRRHIADLVLASMEVIHRQRSSFILYSIDFLLEALAWPTLRGGGG